MEITIMGYIGFVLLVDGSGEHRPVLYTGVQQTLPSHRFRPVASGLRLRLHGRRAPSHSCIPD